MSASTETAGFAKPRPRHRWARYAPLAIWALLIFFASSSMLSGSNTAAFVGPILHWLFPHFSEATLNFIHSIVIRKGAHFTEYAVLALFAVRAFKSSSHEWLRSRWFLVSLLLVVAYSLSDEFHQSFVSSRTASIYDCMIDSFGGLTMLALVAVRNRRSPTTHYKMKR
jgi:hypothetical protein